MPPFLTKSPFSLGQALVPFIPSDHSVCPSLQAQLHLSPSSSRLRPVPSCPGAAPGLSLVQALVGDGHDLLQDVARVMAQWSCGRRAARGGLWRHGTQRGGHGLRAERARRDRSGRGALALAQQPTAAGPGATPPSSPPTNRRCTLPTETPFSSIFAVHRPLPRDAPQTAFSTAAEG